MRPRPAAHLAVAVALAGVVYFPITGNYFAGDDWIGLQAIASEPPGRWIFRPHGGHLLAFRNLLFSLFYHGFGPRPAYWFGTVLATHLVNVGLLFAVLRRATGSAPLACFGAAAWGVSPVLEGSLGWYSAYGHVVVGTLVLVVLLRVLRRFADPAPLPFLEVLAWWLLMLLAAVTFGVGVGVALVFPVVVALLFSGRRASTASRVLLAVLPVVVVAGYRAWHVLYAEAWAHPDTAAQMAMQFGLARYVTRALVMLLHLVIVGTVAVVAGFAHPVQAYPSTAAYAIAGGVLVLVLAALVGSPPGTRRLLVAMGLVVAGSYAIVAVGRAGLLGALGFPASGAAVPRYHYVGPIGIAILLCLALARLGEWLRVGPRAAHALLASWIGVTLFLYARSGWTIDHFDADRRTVEAAVRGIELAIAASPRGSLIHLRNDHASFTKLGGPSFVGRATIYRIFFRAHRDHVAFFHEPNAAIRDRAPPGPLAASLTRWPRRFWSGEGR